MRRFFSLSFAFLGSRLIAGQTLDSLPNSHSVEKFVVKEELNEDVVIPSDVDVNFPFFPIASFFSSPFGVGGGFPFAFNPILEGLGMMMMEDPLVPEVTVNGTSCVVSVDVHKLNVTDSHTLNIKAEGRTVTVEFSDVKQPSNEVLEKQEQEVAESLDQGRKAFRGSHRLPVSSFASVQTFQIPSQCGEADESSKATVDGNVLRLQFPVLGSEEENVSDTPQAVNDDNVKTEDGNDEPIVGYEEEHDLPVSEGAPSEISIDDESVEMVHQRRLLDKSEEKPAKKFTWIPVVAYDEF